MTPLSVLITADVVGGVWQYAAELAAALPECGVQPTLAVVGPAPSPAQRAIAAGIPLIDTGLPLDWLADGPETVRAAGERLAAIAAGYDLLHCNTPALLASGRRSVPALAAVHGCMSTWWDAAYGTQPDAAFDWQRQLTVAGLAAADLVVAPTRAYATVVQRHYGLSTTPIAVHNGRRPLVQVPQEAEDIVFTAGRLWDQVKDTPLLARVAARIDAPLLAAGPIQSPHGERVALASLRWVGVLDEGALAGHLARQPIFVSAARFEPFGLAVLEAAAAGCPLVLADLATFRELWDGAATFVPVGDEDGFVTAIESLRADPHARAQAGDAARERAGRYTPAALAGTMADLYRRVQGGAGRGRQAA